MDKELLRIVIIITGIAVMAGMVYWSYLGSRKSRQKLNFYDDNKPLDNIDESLIINNENDDFEITPLGTAIDDDHMEENQELNGAEEEVSRPETDVSGVEYSEDSLETVYHEPAAITLPSLIQFNIAAPDDEQFSGVQLIPVLELVGLIYGSTQVFERLDADNMVDFTVASMANPGIIPLTDPETYSCPGLAFYFQPGELDNPVAAYDDLIAVLHEVSGLLGGVELDASRHPLTDDTIQYYRELILAVQ